MTILIIGASDFVGGQFVNNSSTAALLSARLSEQGNEIERGNRTHWDG